MSASAIGYVYIVVTLAGLFGVFSAKLTRKFGEKHIGVTFQLVAIASCVVPGLTNTAPVSVPGVLLLNVVNSLYQPYQMEMQNSL